MEDVKKKLSENSMESDRNIYLCLLAQATHSSKFNIEFNSNSEGYKKMKIDTTTTLKSMGKQWLYYMDNSQDIRLKISRNLGFPHYCSKLCKAQDDKASCFEDFASEKGDCTQIATKVTTISEKPC